MGLMYIFGLTLVKAPPLGECPKDKGGAASGEEAVEAIKPRLRDCMIGAKRPT